MGGTRQFGTQTSALISLTSKYWALDPKAGVATFIASQTFPFADRASMLLCVYSSRTATVVTPWMECEAAVYQSLKA